jgi:FkbM family methyltransferase
MLDFLNRVLASERLKCIDVGARGGVQNTWKPFKALMETDAFEPDATACEREKAAGRPGENWYPVGLGAKTGKAKLYVLKKPSGSSLYPPNPTVMKQFAPGDIGDLDYVLDIDVMGLSDFIDTFKRPLPNLIKLDIQGAELDVLKSMRDEHWGDLLALQVEVEFIDYYIGQPLFADVDAFVKSKGFLLFDLLSNRYYRVKDGETNHYLKKYLNIHLNRHDISCRMVAGDALYMRPPEAILANADVIVCAKYFTILVAYRCLDEALWFIEEMQDRKIIDHADAASLIDFVRSVAPRPVFRQRADKVGKFFRKWCKRLNIGRARKIDYWMDRSWDY